MLDNLWLLLRREKPLYNEANISDWIRLRALLARINVRSMLISLKLNDKSKILFPFIIRKNNGDWLVIKSLNSNGLIYTSHKSEKVLSFNQFEMECDNNILLVEPVEYIRATPPQACFRGMTHLKLGLLLLCCYGVFANLSDILVLQFIIVNIIGLIFSISAFLKDRLGHNSIFSLVCNSFGGKRCFEDKGFSFLGLNFSSYGALFFGTQLIGLILTGEHKSYLIYIAILLAIPFVFYSLYVQFFVRNKTCAICLLIILAFICNLLLHLSCARLFTLQLESEAVYLFMLGFIWSILLYDSYQYMKDSDTQLISAKFNFFFSRPGFLVYDQTAKEICNDERCSFTLPPTGLKEYDIALHLHPKCVHCESALREILNLTVLDEGCQVKIQIHYHDEKIIAQFIRTIREKIESRSIHELYSSYILWKKTIGEDSLSHNLENAPPYFPYLEVKKMAISSFQGFENIKVALALDKRE